MTTTMRPINHVNETNYKLLARWKIRLDHLDVTSCSSSTPMTSIPIFLLEKQTKYMTPDAHFYGLKATCFVIDKKGLPITAKHFQKDYKNLRDVMVILCTLDGGRLPEVSWQHYPGERIICPVSYSIFKDMHVDTEVCMGPDPDRVDVQKTPRQQWIYAPKIAGQVPDENEVRIRVDTRLRDYQSNDGRIIKYALGGLALHQKIIRHPLDRDAGLHVPLGPDPGHIARPGLGTHVTVTTTKKVLVNQDFLIAGVPIRVEKLIPSGFQGRRILAG